jgi:DNA-binding NarL/FixJ family response regulator
METAAVARLSDSAAGHEDQVVGIVGVDEFARRRIVDVLEHSGVKVGAEAATLTELLTGDSPPNAVVVSGAESRSAAVEQIQRVRRELPAAHVVLVAAADGNGAVPNALRAGASGFVAFDSIDRALAPSVQAVLAGQVSVPAGGRSQLDSQPLTAREKQTLALVVMGLTNGEIAGKLFLAESTVKSHLSSAFNKLGVRSRNEAAAMILDPHSGMGPGILTIPTEDREAASPRP